MGDAEQKDSIEVAGYTVLARFPSAVDSEVFAATVNAEPSRRVLIEHVARGHSSARELEGIMRDEARTQPKNAHKNVTAIVDFFETEDSVDLVLEHVIGCSVFELNNLLRERAYALSSELAAYVVSELLAGLHHVHTALRADGGGSGMVIKRLLPERVLLGDDGTVKFATASLTRVMARPEHLAQSPERYGYYAVEWVAGEPLTPVSNVYSAGVILFELLMGRPCFLGHTVEDVLHQIASRGVRSKELVGNGVPQALASIVERATRVVPEQRFSSAQEMAQALKDWLHEREEKDQTVGLARFLATHGLAEKVATPSSLALVPASEDELFGLRKPARRTVTKVGLRSRSKSST